MLTKCPQMSVLAKSVWDPGWASCPHIQALHPGHDSLVNFSSTGSQYRTEDPWAPRVHRGTRRREWVRAATQLPATEVE